MCRPTIRVLKMISVPFMEHRKTEVYLVVKVGLFVLSNDLGLVGKSSSMTS
jgi:hypothetical protein